MSNKKETAITGPSALLLTDPVRNREAEELAERLDIPVITDPHAPAAGLILCLDQDGMALRLEDQLLRGDFSGMRKRLRTGNLQKELLVRAVRIRGQEKITVLDAAAGMGEDALIMAASGCRVILYEKDPVIAALLRNAIERASDDPSLAEIVKRMEFHEGDSIEAMREMKTKVDVVYLDPMFPEKKKNSLTKKKFQLLHYLESPCEEEESLLEAAIGAEPARIVIKRPLKGPWLAGRKPAFSFKGKAIRYDCLVFAR